MHRLLHLCRLGLPSWLWLSGHRALRFHHRRVLRTGPLRLRWLPYQLGRIRIWAGWSHLNRLWLSIWRRHHHDWLGLLPWLHRYHHDWLHLGCLSSCNRWPRHCHHLGLLCRGWHAWLGNARLGLFRRLVHPKSSLLLGYVKLLHLVRV